MDQEEAAYALKHFGVKGMHWGVRRDRDTSRGAGSNDPYGGVKNLSAHDHAVLKSAGLSTDQSPVYEAKYGPESSGSSKRHLTSQQKNLLIGAAVGVGVVGLVAYGVHADKAITFKNLEANVGTNAAHYLLKSDAVKGANAKGLRDISKLGTEDLSFEPGHLFSRVSTEAEKLVKPDGFYASHKPEDLERYKAVLPVYWKMWAETAGKTSGYVNHYASESSVKVASEKTLFDIIKNQMDREAGGTHTLRDFIDPFGTDNGKSSNEEFLKKHFYATVAKFTDPDDVTVKRITKLVREAGYHGIVDANDSGSLAASPVKMLTGAGFKIVKVEPLSESAIKLAQQGIGALGHILALIRDAILREEVFVDQESAAYALKHFGVKGMHWGAHRVESQARSDANEHTKAKLFYGEGAGTRRKLIKAKVESRSKNPAYKKAFDAAVAKQNLDKRASQATRARRRKDTTKFVGKTTRGVNRRLTGGFGSVTVTAAAIAAGASYLHSTGADKVLLQKASSLVHNPSAQNAAKEWMRQAGARSG